MDSKTIGWVLMGVYFTVTFVIMLCIFWYCRDEYKKRLGTWDYIWSIVIALFLMIFEVLLTVEKGEKDITGTYKTVYIENFSDKFYVSGNFTMGSGEVKEQLKYNCYIPMKDGSIKLFSMDSNRVTIRYTNERPHILIFTSKERSKMFPNWTSSSTSYTLYIPKGSIQNSMNGS